MIIFILFFVGIFFLIHKAYSKKNKHSNYNIKEVEQILINEVDFYNKITSVEDKKHFLDRVFHFIEKVIFTDISNAKHTLSDEVLIAASAIIPLYFFPKWEYNNIHEILLYEDHFDTKFKVDAENHIMGMVGSGALNNSMALSIPALRQGFEANDGNQTALHEFIHLIDKADGAVDGVPEYLIPKHLIEPWLRLIKEMMTKIKDSETNINPYAATNEAEFFAVIAEYFFEKPKLLARDHPALFAILEQIFERKLS